MSLKRSKLLPYQPLERIAAVALELQPWASDWHQGYRDEDLATLFGVSKRTVARWRDEGLSLWAADKAALAMGLHPALIWDEWLDPITVAITLLEESEAA